MTLAASFLTGFGVSLSLIMAIGAQNAFVLRQGLRQEHVGPVVLFCALADLTLMALGVTGLGAVLHRLPVLASVLTWCGVVFLVWYGLGAFRRALRPGTLRAEGAGTAASVRTVLAKAAAFTLLNPHVYLDTVLLVGSIGAARAPGGQAAFVAGGGSASAVWFAALGYGARLLAPLFARPVAWRVLDLLVGVVMLGIAGSLAVRAGV